MALLLHPETPILGVLGVVAAEIRRTKTPYKPAWMPFAEGRYTLLENHTRHYVSSDLHGGIIPVLVVLLFGT